MRQAAGSTAVVMCCRFDSAVADYTDGRPEATSARQGLRLRSGVFGIQGHDKTTDLSFRNLRAGEMPEEMLRK